MKNILLLIDMQNGFTNCQKINDLVKKTKDMLSLNLFDEIVATQFINYDNSVYEQLMNWSSLKSNDETTIRSELQPYATDVITKSIYTCAHPNFIQRLCQLNDGKYPESFSLLVLILMRVF